MDLVDGEGRGFGGMTGGRLAELARTTAVSAAAGEAAGELFRYSVKTPVTIARQSSAMLPIVAAEVSGEKLSIYNASAHPKHPFSGFRLKNATPLSLLAGPVTVFDDGVYAGDAQLANLQPGEERLLSYGLDLACTVERKEEPKPRELVSVRIVKGVLHSRYKLVRETAYTVKNKKGEAKTVLVEHPYRHGWKLLTPKRFDERTESLYRFRVPLKGLETKKLAVASERVQTQTYALTNINSNFVGVYVRSRVVSPRVKAALERIVAMKLQLNGLSRTRKELEGRRSTLHSEQKRIRSNMSSISRSSKLYARYLEKMGAQEDRIERLLDEIESARKAENAKRREIDQYLANLTLE